MCQKRAFSVEGGNSSTSRMCIPSKIVDQKHKTVSSAAPWNISQHPKITPPSLSLGLWLSKLLPGVSFHLHRVFPPVVPPLPIRGSSKNDVPPELNLQRALGLSRYAVGQGEMCKVNHIQDGAESPCDCQLALCWEMSLIPVIVCLFHGTLKWELSSGWPHKQLSHKHFSSASPKMA